MATKDTNTTVIDDTADTCRIPMMLPGQTLQSLRIPVSILLPLAEVIDNSLEANGNLIQVRLDDARVKGKNRVVRVVIADDGEGMDQDILHRYLQLGFSTRYMRRDTIGKYGVGTKLAALNFAEKIDVWSRTDGESDWLHVTFDLGRARTGEEGRYPAGHRQTVSTTIPRLPGGRPSGKGRGLSSSGLKWTG